MPHRRRTPPVRAFRTYSWRRSPAPVNSSGPIIHSSPGYCPEPRSVPFPAPPSSRVYRGTANSFERCPRPGVRSTGVFTPDALRLASPKHLRFGLTRPAPPARRRQSLSTCVVAKWRPSTRRPQRLSADFGFRRTTHHGSKNTTRSRRLVQRRPVRPTDTDGALRPSCRTRLFP